VNWRYDRGKKPVLHCLAKRFLKLSTDFHMRRIVAVERRNMQKCNGYCARMSIARMIAACPPFVARCASIPSASTTVKHLHGHRRISLHSLDNRSVIGRLPLKTGAAGNRGRSRCQPLDEPTGASPNEKGYTMRFDTHESAENATRPALLAYSVEGATAATGLSRSLIFELMAAGKLERVKIGKRTLIPADSLRALVTGNAA
jgi:hypothetical protein